MRENLQVYHHSSKTLSGVASLQVTENTCLDSISQRCSVLPLTVSSILVDVDTFPKQWENFQLSIWKITIGKCSKELMIKKQHLTTFTAEHLDLALSQTTVFSVCVLHCSLLQRKRPCSETRWKNIKLPESLI